MIKKENNFHTGVLMTEVLQGLSIFPEEVYLDCTFGGGTHSKEILNLGGKVVGLEVDLEAIENAKQSFGLVEKDGVWVTPEEKLKIYWENFKDLDTVVERSKVEKISGVLFDLGVSSYQLDTAERGFSFSKEGPLDMRLDSRLTVSAKELLEVLNEGELYELFTKLGGEHHARSIARDIVRYRRTQSIETTKDLVRIIGEKKLGLDKIHPATKVFMSLRIAVNDELNNIKQALPKAVRALSIGGRLVVISFHSLEDKIVKDFFKNEQHLKLINEKPIIAALEEQKLNPRSRSAKLRIAEKI